jgi:NAD+ kinase
MRIALYTKQFSPENQEYLLQIIQSLRQHEAKVFIHNSATNESPELKNHVDGTFESSLELKKNADYLISIGGDGTFLDTILLVKDSGIPILGINTGRLGFLANVTKNEYIKAIESLIKGHFELEKRNMLMLETDSEIFEGNKLALNDFVIHKKETSSMIIVHTYLNGEFLNSYWADGLIISTPTGSTGYSLSCGGPVIFPESSSFAITPISPHNLNVRPVIIPDSGVVSFEIEGRGTNFMVSLDSRSYTVNNTVQMAVRKCDYQLNVIKLHEKNYLETLREKLTWGKDQRN